MKKTRLILLIFLLEVSIKSLSQNFISKQYGLQTIKTNLVYGIATNYLGAKDTLKLDIYKPSGNANSKRPLIILNHGGAWLGGDKSETSIVQLANEFAQRGYVVASVNYRLGIHKANWALTPFQKQVNAGFHAAYIADSAEVYRAIYRAIQDIKGAIRFMKGRNLLDSTCSNAVFVGGESAGGFNSMGVAFMDLNSEKPASCNVIGDVPMPQSNLLDNYPGSNVTSTQLKRPDLGDIHGDLNLNGYDARVNGVFNLFGGFLSEAMSKNWLSGNDSIAIYMTHQTCDGIVPCNIAVALSPMSINCNLGYTPFHTKWPLSYGSCALLTNFNSITPKINQLKSELFNCDPIVFPLTDCVRFANNGSYHFTINSPVRCDSISRFLAPMAIANTQNCQKNAGIKSYKNLEIYIYPNPNNGLFYIQLGNNKMPQEIEIADVLGRKMDFEWINPNQILLKNADGLYFLKIKTEHGINIKTVIVLTQNWN